MVRHSNHDPPDCCLVSIRLLLVLIFHRTLWLSEFFCCHDCAGLLHNESLLKVAFQVYSTWSVSVDPARTMVSVLSRWCCGKAEHHPGAEGCELLCRTRKLDIAGPIPSDRGEVFVCSGRGRRACHLHS
jgi:hypothetical protein